METEKLGSPIRGECLFLRVWRQPFEVGIWQRIYIKDYGSWQRVYVKPLESFDVCLFFAD